MKVRYSYLPQQFENPDEIFQGIRKHLVDCQFTLGKEVSDFEASFAALIGTKYAVGVGSGTDALKLGLRAAGVTHGDEVITAANTFIATVGAINETGAKPVLVDATAYYTMDVDKIERAITPRTKAILPVHLTGEPADMKPIMEIAARHRLHVIEDACQSILANIEGKNAGTFGLAGGFSLHPLKNLNVWGDAGIVVTNSEEAYSKLRLLRNHGLKNRDEIELLGYNSRLDSIQAIVGNWLIKDTRKITEARIANGKAYDKAFADLEGRLTLPPRRRNVSQVFHLYMFEVAAEERDNLFRFLNEKGVEAKIHYPIPLFLQNGLKHLGYKPGDFPMTENQAKRVITLPVDQHLSQDQVDYTIQTVRQFFKQ